MTWKRYCGCKQIELFLFFLFYFLLSFKSNSYTLIKIQNECNKLKKERRNERMHYDSIVSQSQPTHKDGKRNEKKKTKQNDPINKCISIKRIRKE